jgi:hypothetical protein
MGKQPPRHTWRSRCPSASSSNSGPRTVDGWTGAPTRGGSSLGNGRLPAIRLGGPDGPLRFAPEDLEAWISRARRSWRPSDSSPSTLRRAAPASSSCCGPTSAFGCSRERSSGSCSRALRARCQFEAPSPCPPGTVRGSMSRPHTRPPRLAEPARSKGPLSEARARDSRRSVSAFAFARQHGSVWCSSDEA